MSKGLVRAVGLSCLAGILALATEAQGAATISLRAVKKNGVAITPTNSVTVAPNDTIEAEVVFFGWSSPPFDGAGGLVKTYQATLDGAAGAVSNGADPNDLTRLVLPTFWNAPINRVTCPCTPPFECTAQFGPQYGCTLPGFNPATMASIATSRTDFILFGFPNFTSESEASLNIRWGGTIDGNDGQSSGRCSAPPASVGFSCTTAGECGAGGVCNANFVSYAGTLNLKAGSQVCGTTTYTFVANEGETFLAAPGFIVDSILPTTIQGLTISVPTNPSCPPPLGACCNDATGACQENVTDAACNTRWGGAGSTCATIEPICAPVGACCNDTTDVCTESVTQAACGANRWGGGGTTCAQLNPPCITSNTPIAWNPANCIIDARRPFPPNQAAARQGFTSWTWTFQNPLTAGEDAPSDFTIRQVPATTPPVPPTIGSVTPGAGNTLTLNFRNAANTADFPIQPNRWTCVKHNASNVEKCIGYLPADASGNRTAAPADILDIIDNLNGVRNPPLQIYQCDIDRSNICAAADIITEIDLLNGVNGFPNQNGDTLEVCPTAP